MKILVDTIMYNPCLAVLEIDKNNKIVKVFDIEKAEIIALSLYQSNVNEEQYFFRFSRQTFWLHCLFDFDKIENMTRAKKELVYEICSRLLNETKGGTSL